MVMEYLEGGDLAAWLDQRGRLAFDQAVEFVLQAAVAIADAHALGIIHRDLKPANLFCVKRSDGQLTIKVLDFGISKIMATSKGGREVAVTRTGSMMGSPAYMSPEQMQAARTVDARADIWGLGGILFELIAGVPPFDAPTLMEVAVKIVTEPPPVLQNLRPGVPDELVAIIGKCLEKDPNARYQTVRELVCALEPFGGARARGLVERVSGIIEGAASSAAVVELAVTPSRSSKPSLVETLAPSGWSTEGGSVKRSAAIAIAVTSLAVLGAVATFAFRPRTTQAEAQQAPAAAAPPAPPPPSAAWQTVDSPQPVPFEVAASAKPAVPPTSPRSLAVTPSPPKTDVVRPALAPEPNPPIPHAPAAPTKPAVDCSQPFTIDSRNHHVPRPECL
jgi:serine/threonine-protein kinase